MNYQPGTLVRTRQRDWIVLPSGNEDLLLLKPLGGSDEDTRGIYLPLGFDEKITPSEFPLPAPEDVGDFFSAKLLFNASRLSFRNGAGPFRSLGKLSFRPRSYQMVPLIMALRQEPPIRLFVADDVGIGKTVEALLIVKELLERREIKRFAVIALSHLCDQWQKEVKEKFGIDAVIIRSNTQARLDREIQGDTSVFQYYPFQIISVDYIKSDTRRNTFIKECPELVIVDEVHTCSRPAGATTSQQQRHQLIRKLADKENQGLILLTATPHSGKREEFQSLIGLLNKEYEAWDIIDSSQEQRTELAARFIQRRRKDVILWMKETTPFPERESQEVAYPTSPEYLNIYNQVIRFATTLTANKDGTKQQQRFRYWSALALLRGVMSSPDAGIEMIRNRIEKSELSEEEEEILNPVIVDEAHENRDTLPFNILSRVHFKARDNTALKDIASQLENLAQMELDSKVQGAFRLTDQWIKEGLHPVIFCRYIATANYVGRIFKQRLGDSVDVQVITSEDPDELRKSRIEQMGDSGKRCLIATDCLSEGINLQDLFTAVLHYDLPWNPNRLEQREGRVDRFGQSAPLVKTYLLFSQDNPVDGVVLKVLLRKIKEIRRSTGISIPFPENSENLMDAVFHAVLKEAAKYDAGPDQQLLEGFEDAETVKEYKLKTTHAIEEAAKREQTSRSIFAQNAIKAEEIEEDLKISDEAIGRPEDVEEFVLGALKNLMGIQIDQTKEGFRLYTNNLEIPLKESLPPEKTIKITFYSPVPEGYYYIGRNHPFVENLCQILLSRSLEKETKLKASRSAVIRTREVRFKTTLFVFRVRNVVAEGDHRMIAEEMLLWGYRGNPEDEDFLIGEQVKELIDKAEVSGGMNLEDRQRYLQNELTELSHSENKRTALAEKRALILIEHHRRYRKLMKEKGRMHPVKPVLPMDILGLYILLPEIKL